MANYALEGPKWGSSSVYGSTGGQVTWSFATYNYSGQAYTFDNSIGDTNEQTAIREAFAKWENVCNIDFVEVTDAASVAIRLGLDAIDGESNTVGECYYTYSDGRMNSSEIRFDTAETFTFQYLYEVALHEIGHAIGFAHYEGSASIMNAYTGDASDLTAGDIEGAVYVYGAPVNNGTIYPGGPDDDTYFVSNAADVVNEAANQGYDTVLASISYALKTGQSIELLATTNAAATTAINLTGNDQAQTITGNAGVNFLSGLGGNDILNGGAGTDSLRGGLGNDSYFVDHAGDVIVEVSGEGLDTVRSSETYALGASNSVEFLQTTNQAGLRTINLSGNNFGQTIYGNGGNNILSGLGGNDVLKGLGGNDTINGGSGTDTMYGGLGNDSFFVENASDVIVESNSQGKDTVRALVSYELTANAAVEALQTTAQTGTAAINLTGNIYGQGIYGNAGANNLIGYGGGDNLKGLGGNDRLYGGAGNDLLFGGIGKDVFVFQAALSAATNVDTITDFSAVDDTIQLDHAVFASVYLPNGTLNAAYFTANADGVAKDANDRIVYETDTGKLFYDSNGSAVGGSMLFATLTSHPTVTASDFLVV